ncbi:MAG: spermidine/putrescine ABC transporter substrate-binding protein [Thermoanaerobaculia bacterium]
MTPQFIHRFTRRLPVTSRGAVGLAAVGFIAALASLAGCAKPTAEAPAAASATAATAAVNKKDAGKLNIYIWSAYLPKEVLDDFTAKTGIQVNFDTYDSNEALLEKLQSGVADYDLVVPSDYMVRILTAEKLVQQLDHAKLPNIANLDPRFLDKKFDPKNEHSLPYFWGTTGFGYNKKKLGTLDSWQAIFDPKNKGRILMLDDMREVFGAALKSMGKSLNTTDPAILKQAADLLKKQKKLVATYNSGDFANILAAGDVDIAHGYNGQLAEVVAKEPEKLAYVVPKEGATLWMDNVCIPAKARNVENAYKFLNFIMEPEVNAAIVNGVSYASANVPAKKFIKPEILNDASIYPSDDVIARCEFIEDIGDTTTVLDQYWTEIKAQ